MGSSNSQVWTRDSNQVTIRLLIRQIYICVYRNILECVRDFSFRTKHAPFKHVRVKRVREYINLYWKIARVLISKISSATCESFESYELLELLASTFQRALQYEQLKYKLSVTGVTRVLHKNVENTREIKYAEWRWFNVTNNKNNNIMNALND